MSNHRIRTRISALAAAGALAALAGGCGVGARHPSAHQRASSPGISQTAPALAPTPPTAANPAPASKPGASRRAQQTPTVLAPTPPLSPSDGRPVPAPKGQRPGTVTISGVVAQACSGPIRKGAGLSCVQSATLSGHRRTYTVEGDFTLTLPAGTYTLDVDHCPQPDLVLTDNRRGLELMAYGCVQPDLAAAPPAPGAVRAQP